MLLGDIPERNARFYPDKAAVTDSEVKISHAQFYDRVKRLGNFILSAGLGKGDRVAVLSHNCHQYLELYFACVGIGTPVVPLNFRYSPSELLYVIRDSGARMIFYAREYAGSIDVLKQNPTEIVHFICVNDSERESMTYNEIVSCCSAVPPAVSIDEDDVAVLGYTGGTTGKPKGVMTTHRNIITSCYNTALERGISLNDIFLNVPPVFHAGGANSMFAFAFLGATNVFLNTSSIDLILKAVKEHRITNFVLVPTMIMSLLENPNIGRYDLKSLKEIYYGTAPISVEPLKRLMKLMNCRLSQTYGMTETFVPVSILKAEDHVWMGEAAVQRLSSAGRPVMGVKVKIVDDRGNDVETGRVGEIMVQGKNVMKGYWKQPELTREVLKDGWLSTGDLGYMDELGYLFIVDRKKDMIISGGENIYAKEVEDVLFSHPDVANAVVIGVPDEKWGEAVKALVVKKKGTEFTEKELIDFCKERLAGYKKPKSVEFMQDFPKSAAGKILKRELRQKYWQGREKKI